MPASVTMSDVAEEVHNASRLALNAPRTTPSATPVRMDSGLPNSYRPMHLVLRCERAYFGSAKAGSSKITSPSKTVARYSGVSGRMRGVIVSAAS